ncbi:28S ribosomal protein S5, mitochondrial [Cephus cinctus]|uniref:Small ribosomal subunit protein uS5m n=1 Tax=Cephus cinctus TaxID=211228 RepID=A0AAJ7BZH8_CEPCN|nr:28S ribosomal protein S5, mitochondrial [Cephus cinctus]
MASRLLRAFGLISNPLKKTTNNNNGLICQQAGMVLNLLTSHVPVTNIVRSTSFFNKLPAESLWKGVTSVSNAGRKRGRARAIGKKGIKNLNRGQVIGIGKINMQWPGLTSPILRGRELIQQHKLPEDPEREAKLIQLRDSMTGFKKTKLSPIERGWTGDKMGGRSIGPPDPIGEDTFEGFDTRVLEFKIVTNMTGNMGRKRRTSAFVITGNGNGLAGFALGKALDSRAALKTAKNRAAQKLIYINMYNNHTVLHDFYCQFGKTKIFVTKQYEGFGLVCHRAIKTCCEVIGIKDLHAKVEGSTNLQHIIKAFFIGLLQQKSHQELAEKKKLHLVEFRKENDYFPTLIASPSKVRTENYVSTTEIRDFKQYVLGGKIMLEKRKLPPFFVKQKSWMIRQRKQEYLRNQDKVRLRMLAEHGELRSFLTDKYPEAKPRLMNFKSKRSAEAEAE